MNLGDLTGAANLVSSLAVLVSLAFLGLQIRQGNRNQRSLMQQGRSARNVELLSRLTDPRLADLMTRVARNGQLEDAEYFQLYGYIAAVFWSYEDCFLQFRRGMLDAQSWSSDVATLKRMFGNTAYRAVWKAARGAFGDEYRAFLDGLSAETRPNEMDLASVLKQSLAEERQAR